MQTFLQFKERLRAEIWPTGEARRLRLSHDPFFNEAMMDIQRWVDCYRQFHTATFDFSTTQWDDAKTVVDAPYGKIRRVYTVAGGTDRWRDKVRYKSSTFDEINCWSNNLFAATTPMTTPVLSYGVRTADASQDSAFGRARVGIWAINRRKLYIAPYIQSTELLVVDWDGTKTKWLDSDGVDETIWAEAELAIKTYVQWRHEMCFGDDRNYAQQLKRDYDMMLADLIHFCRENTAQQADHVCNSDGGGAELSTLNQDDINDDDDSNDPDPTEEDHVTFDAVGDVGDTGSNAATVAAAIIADNPEVFLALGDLTYNGDYAGDFAANYQSFIDAGNLIPVVGNHDYSDNGNSFTAFKNYFANFVTNDGLHFEKTTGPIHWLIYNTEDTDGVDANSTQAEWLRVKLMLSTARWKIVLMHRPPFSSDSTHGSDTDLQLDFKARGAHLVLAAHAHDYERIEVDGLTYINVGTGGHGLYSFGTSVAGSQVRYNSAYGRLIGEVDCDSMVLTFKNVSGDIIDTKTITHD